MTTTSDSSFTDHGQVPSIYNDCKVYEWNTTIPWDNPNSFISARSRTIFQRVVTSVIIPILVFTGVPANILNMIVFYKQSLAERINLCLFSLACADLLWLIYMLFKYMDSLYMPFTDELFGMINAYMSNNNVVGFNGVGYVSAFISTIISVERCVCVLFPLRAQRCIPTKVLGAIIVVCSLVIGGLRYVCTAIYRVNCVYEARTGRVSRQSFTNDYYSRNKELVYYLNGIFFGFCLKLGCPLIVFITTAITAIKLRQSLRFRHQSSSSAMSDKEIGVTKMLIWVSLEFLVVSTPAIFLRSLPMFGTEVKVSGDNANLFYVLASCNMTVTSAGAAVNFLIYYLTGARFRTTLRQLIGCRSSSRKNSEQSASSNKSAARRRCISAE